MEMTILPYLSRPDSRTSTSLVKLFFVFIMLVQVPQVSRAQQKENMSEAAVPPYILPNPLLAPDAKLITTAAGWNAVQRPGIYHLFEENVYGRYPAQSIPLRFVLRESGTFTAVIKARRKQVRIYFLPTDSTVYLDVLIYLPASHKGSVPVFAAYNFSGNPSIANDPAILPPGRQHAGPGPVLQPGAPASDTASWPVGDILRQGYGLAVAWYRDIEPDNSMGWKSGIRSTLQQSLAIKPEAWGAVGAWAWGLSRLMDYLQQDRDIDGKKVALLGHSRLGKAALWAGASDRRFSIVVSNESGEGGAALSKRWYGETIEAITKHFPHWFVPAYQQYANNTTALPVDQHMLLSLIAPRPLYVASAAGDQWSDPKGEFLAAVNAGPVYALFGKRGIGTDSLPPLMHPVGENIRYHIRPGKHGITRYDWQQYLAFATEQWRR
jgi:hypothetical protein